MPMVKNYAQFDGQHWETGTVRNVLAHLGVVAPHTHQPLSEPMMLGISGGAVFGYFLFDYKGADPLLSLISRNTFDPFETLLTRLAVPREQRQTPNAAKAERNLLDALESNQPAIVWADAFSLPYNDATTGNDVWAMYPLVVFGLDGDLAHIADRSRRPFTVSRAQLAAARARVKKDKHRVLTLGAPDLSKLKDAVQKGIWQSVSLYTEKPPKGAKTNFGFTAYRHWAAMLTNTRNPHSWARFYPAGAAWWSAVAGGGFSPGLLGWVYDWGFGDGFERGAYADFLDEAAILLRRPKLSTAAEYFRNSRDAWLALAQIAMPDDVPLCREARELKLRKHRRFIDAGPAALDEIRAANTRLREIRNMAARDFPITPTRLADIHAAMSAQVMTIHDIEYEAVKTIQAAMG